MPCIPRNKDRHHKFVLHNSIAGWYNEWAELAGGVGLGKGETRSVANFSAHSIVRRLLFMLLLPPLLLLLFFCRFRCCCCGYFISCAGWTSLPTMMPFYCEPGWNKVIAHESPSQRRAAALAILRAGCVCGGATKAERQAALKHSDKISRIYIVHIRKMARQNMAEDARRNAATLTASNGLNAAKSQSDQFCIRVTFNDHNENELDIIRACIRFIIHNLSGSYTFCATYYLWTGIHSTSAHNCFIIVRVCAMSVRRNDRAGKREKLWGGEQRVEKKSS